MKTTGLLIFACTLLLASCTTVKTDPKSGLVTKTEFLPPAAMWEVLGNLTAKKNVPATPSATVVRVRAEK